MSGSLLVLGGPQPAGLAVVSVPAQAPEPPPGQGAEFGKASPIALVVIVLLALATILLIRSMTKHLRRVPASFDPAPPDDPAPQDGPALQDDPARTDDGPAAGDGAPHGPVAAADATRSEHDARRER